MPSEGGYMPFGSHLLHISVVIEDWWAGLGEFIMCSKSLLFGFGWRWLMVRV